jgi:hypothetical protein
MQRMRHLGAQVNQFIGVDGLAPPMCFQIESAFQALQRHFAFHPVLGHRLPGRQDESHQFEVGRFQEGGGNRALESLGQWRNADQVAGIGMGQGHKRSPGSKPIAYLNARKRHCA